MKLATKKIESDNVVTAAVPNSTVSRINNLYEGYGPGFIEILKEIDKMEVLPGDMFVGADRDGEVFEFIVKKVYLESGIFWADVVFMDVVPDSYSDLVSNNGRLAIQEIMESCEKAEDRTQIARTRKRILKKIEKAVNGKKKKKKK